MIGPSSSHTAGAARIGKAARNIFGRQPKKIVISFYGSFATTYKGHGTDVAIIGGLLGFNTFDNRIVDSLVIAKDLGLDIEFLIKDDPVDHPNTVKIYLEDDAGTLNLTGLSIGGGKIEITEINGFKLKVSGLSPSLLVFHEDRFGVIASVSNVLNLFEINIGYMEVARKEKGSLALMVIETDQLLTHDVISEIKALQHVKQVTLLKTS